MQLCFELHPFLVCFIHDVPVLLQLVDFDLVLCEPLLALLLDLLDGIFELIYYLIVIFLVQLLQLRDLVLKRNRSLQLRIVFFLEATFDLCPIDFLLGETVVQFSYIFLSKEEFDLFSRGLQLCDFFLFIVQDRLELSCLTIEGIL